MIDLGLSPNMQAPRITLTCGLFGTRIVSPSYSNLFLIVALRYGLSEKPPTIKMKFTGDPVFSASFKSSPTLSSIFSKSGWKKLFIKLSGSSTPEAPF